MIKSINSRSFEVMIGDGDFLANMVRTPCSDKSGLRKGTWTPEEDRKLKAYVTRYGCWNWRQLPKYAGLARCGKSCRLRWLNYLRPNIKRGNYSKEEEETIMRLHKSLGNRWSAIAAQLHGRTDNEIKNHWHTTLKKRAIKHKPVATNDGELCNISEDPVVVKCGSTSKDKEEIFELNNDHVQINPSSPLSILESSLFCPQQPASSSDQNSSITTENTVVSSNHSVSDDNNNNDDDDKALFEAYEASSGDFWTEPFLWDSSSYMSSDMLASMSMTMNPAGYAFEAEFPFLDGEILCPLGFHDQLQGLNF